MHLLSFLADGEPRFGAAVTGGVVDLTQRLGPKCPDLRSLIDFGPAEHERALSSAEDVGDAIEPSADDVRSLTAALSS